MCTVTFIPQQQGGFVLTQNRDETPLRKGVLFPSSHIAEHSELLFPKDGEAGGTWLSISTKGRVAALLNGAFENHKRTPPYRKSRGLVVLESFDFNTPQEFAAHYDFENIEPFTLILIESQPELELWELRWDGTQTHLKQCNALQEQIWSSSPLYNAAMRAERESWFETWKNKAPHTADSILHFHHTAGNGDPETDVKMVRPYVQTVSITQITQQEGNLCMQYHDLLTQEKSAACLHQHSPVHA